MGEIELKMLMILGLLIGALCPHIPTRHDRFIRDVWPKYVDEQKANFALPKLIRKHFGLSNNQVDSVTFLHYVTGYCTKISFGLLIIPCVFLDVNTFTIVFAVFAIVFLLANIPEAFLTLHSTSKKDIKHAKESLFHRSTKNQEAFPEHSCSTSVRHLFEQHFDDFERMKTILLQDKMSSTVFSKKGIVLNYSHLTRCKKHFTSDDHVFALGFFEKINPFYLDVENGIVQFDFMTRKGDPPMIVWSDLERDSETFLEFIGEDSEVERLNNQWYMVVFK